MRVLLHQDKKAISNIVAYVLLISITIGLSITVYNWLRFYVSEEIVEQCPDSVNIIIEDYNCTSGTNGFLNITLKNKGLFSVDGYILRVHDSSDAEFGFYVLTDTGTPITPGAKDITIYPFNESYNGKCCKQNYQSNWNSPKMMNGSISQSFCKSVMAVF